MDDQEVILSSPIKVSNNGELDDCQVLTLVCPTKKFIRKTYKLQQMFTQAQVQMAELYSGIADNRDIEEENDDDEKSGFNPDQVMQMLLSSKVDIESVFDEFERLVLLGAVTVNDKKLNTIQWNAITEDDKEGLMAKYLSFFISTLAMKSFKKN